ncbi:SDR family oxidoreductase [Desulfurispirillum indicum]|uniref:Short-chain dehydrogenase/reductase SDR n=1 Tax=Desulfurispirillum indicum (strain ATCC BAA-1389 / DSM 22839 / S5) TaxID=653733 RepID=E6W0Q5_DESIS|nr:SDR family oxidoreductase [Desulfurispirillum indicum]ADU66400.1 short-chain dehydrogenase/reductase SDR [Desulfurispirillum indicum S5]UCZ55733.1 SDR family oxidoreductase [Desulfurispirillum indicum]
MNPVALVTGAAQSIGRVIVEHLCREGWHVAALDADSPAIESARHTWSAGNDSIHWICADVSREAEVSQAIEEVRERWQRLDGVVNNAAISSAHSGPPETLSLEQWRRVLEVNLTGTFLVSRCALPLLRSSRGAVVNIASTRALQSEPFSEAYAASKGGVLSLTHALAASTAGEVRVNAISPGWIDTGPWLPAERRQPLWENPSDHQWHWSGRIGLPQDIASMTAYLLSSAAQFITGQNFTIDGGVSRRMTYPPSP